MDQQRAWIRRCVVLITVLLHFVLPSIGTAQATVPSDSVGAFAQASTGHFGHYAGQALVGAGAGWVAGIGLGWLGSNSIGEQGGEDPGLEGFVIAFPIGFVVGTALGVGLTAKAQGEPRSFLGASLGALAGGGLVVALIPAFEHSPVLYVLAFALPASTAVVSSRYFGNRRRLSVGPTGNGQLGLGLSFAF